MIHPLSPGRLAPYAAACLLAFPALALAQGDTRGFYATLYAQASRLGSTSFDGTSGSSLGPGLKAEFDNGYGFGGDFGYRYGNGWAAEVEWNYRRHGLASLRGGSGAGRVASDGDFASNILFVNGLRRFRAPGRAWTPYVGAGLGWVQEIDFDISSAGGERSNSESGKVAVQLIAGAEIALGTAWSLTTDLRWLRVGDVELTAEASGGGRLARPRYNPVSVQVGVRRSF